MKKLFSFLLAFAVTLSIFTVFSIKSDSMIANSANGLYVSGANLFDASGNKIVLRGVNIAHAWYSGSTTSNISKAKSYGCNAVRIVCADGQKWSKTDYSTLQNIIQTCINNGIICVLEVHDTTGEDSTSYLNTAVNYWKEMKSLLNQYSKYVIVNIANEWMGTWENGPTWQSAYISAVKSLRSAGITNVLMVDAPGYGQETNTMYQYCRKVKEADTTGNIMFSIHMYAVAGKNEQVVKSNIDSAFGLGVCLCIGEFGCAHGASDVDEETIMSYSKAKQVSYFGWSWCGNSGSDAQLDLFYDEYGSNMTAWGKTLFNSTYGIKNTSILPYRATTWIPDEVIDLEGEKNDSDGNNIFLSGQAFIGRSNGTGVVIVPTETADADMNQKVLKADFTTIKSYGGYYSIVFDRESIPTTNTMGVGIWYKTPVGQAGDYNMYFSEFAGSPVAIDFVATNGNWRYIYIPWDNLGGRPDSVSTCNFYFNKIDGKNGVGTLYLANLAVTNIMSEAGDIATNTSMGGNYTNKTEDTDSEADTSSDTETDSEIVADDSVNITVVSSDSSCGSATGSGKYQSGNKITVVAAAKAGYEFVNWTWDGYEISNEAVFTFEPWDRNITLTANFKQSAIPDTDSDSDKYTVTVISENIEFGTVSGGGAVTNGETVCITATSKSGYKFVGWTWNGFEISNEAIFTFEPWDKDITLTANFKKSIVTPPQDILYGDVNDDSNIDILDVVLMRSHIIGIKQLSGDSLIRADLNNDGNVDIIDVVKTRSRIIGQ